MATSRTADLRPHEILGAEAAALANASSLYALVGFIVRTAQHVVRFPKECQELANICINLSVKLTEPEGRLDDVRTSHEFHKCLQDVQLFLFECRQSNILHITWEVVARQKLVGLRTRLSELQKALDTEILVS